MKKVTYLHKCDKVRVLSKRQQNLMKDNGVSI